MHKQKKIAIFIPTYNAGSTVPLVIDRIPEDIKKRVKEIFVIDNASPDNTYLTIIGYKAKKNMSNLKIIRNERNLGYGRALRTGFKTATKELVFYTDGDGQYDVKELPILLSLMTKDVDIANGIKMSRHDPTYRIFIGNLYKLLIDDVD